MRNATVRATVRFWHDEEGWGVLDSTATPGGCWAHYSAVDVDGYRALVAGQSADLIFESADQDGYDWRAVTVRPDGTAPASVVPTSNGSAYRSWLTITYDDEP